MPEVLSVHHTRGISWAFRSTQSQKQQREHKILGEDSSDVTIGLLDSGMNSGFVFRGITPNAQGIWPESESFRDDGMSPVPATWKGSCVNDPKTNASVVVHCNRAGLSPNASVAYSNPRDFGGHGTATGSIAAGMAVGNASMGGLAS
ncbi:subtilisin-like protease SBT5.1 [Selaginella moellendorffii]|uniref:subtilisin-like protease SBT5.1 n=1 Tax=Selaginella moellendorffii TaxID=88036 RepID=UPI000D1CE273|nr:subtilisin-like protease SBT5.1 [Selaginella moellendorffii]|eukprot:XP_024524765.1 subtilisin-like protease SBT5.1 [Selaginella moellendorffii]